jgi:hypothetical protein
VPLCASKLITTVHDISALRLLAVMNLKDLLTNNFN